jgi:hypothetical protein
MVKAPGLFHSRRGNTDLGSPKYLHYDKDVEHLRQAEYPMLRGI